MQRALAHTPLVLLVAVLCVTGCTVAPPQRKLEPQIHPPQDIFVTREQARLRLRALVHPMCGQVEQGADAIIASTTDPDVQRAALRWKIQAIPAIREALYAPDPSTGAEDTLVLCYQMIDYFETGPGKQALGPAASAQAAAVSRQLRDDFTRVLASATISGSVSDATAFARDWAAQHPIRYSIADRQSTLSRVFERPPNNELSTGEAISLITTSLEDLNRKLELFSSQLFRQARWEAELFKIDLLSSLHADQAVPRVERTLQSAERALKSAERALESADHATAAVDRLMPAMERTLAVAQNTPALLTSERQAAVEAMRDEFARTTRFAHDERLAAQEQLTSERRAVMLDLHQTIDQQRTEFAADMDHLAMRKIDYVIQRVTRLAIVAMVAIGLAALLGIFLVRWLFTRRPT